MQRLVNLLDLATHYRERVVMAALTVTTLARFAYVTYLGDDIGGPDGPTYDEAGWDLAARGFMSSEVDGLPYWPPGYPLLVGVHYAIAGRHPYAVKLTQIVMIGFLTWLTFRLAEKLWGPRAGLIAGLGMSGSLVWVALAHPLVYESWQAFFLVVAILLLLRADETRRLWPVVGSGAALGAAAAMQDKFLSLLPLIAAWLVIGPGFRRMRGIAAIAALMVGPAAIVGTLTLRNQIIYGEPVLSTNHGINVLIGIGPNASGGYVGEPSIPSECSDAFNADMSESERDRALLVCSAKYMLNHPLHTASLIPAKLARFWAPFVGPRLEPSWHHFFDWRVALPASVRSTGWFGSVDVALAALWSLGGFVLMVAGFWLLYARERKRPAALLLLSIVWLISVHLVTFADPRYRISALPLIWVTQSVALTYLFDRIGPDRTAPDRLPP